MATNLSVSMVFQEALTEQRTHPECEQHQSMNRSSLTADAVASGPTVMLDYTHDGVSSNTADVLKPRGTPQISEEWGNEKSVGN
ncbi:hypothetical protein STEG23_033958 [Scotinomys teguina]